MILLDTHALIWLASDPEKLSSSARDAIAAHAGAIYCSVVSTWEAALLMKKGRIIPAYPDICVAW